MYRTHLHHPSVLYRFVKRSKSPAPRLFELCPCFLATLQETPLLLPAILKSCDGSTHRRTGAMTELRCCQLHPRSIQDHPLTAPVDLTGVVGFSSSVLASSLGVGVVLLPTVDDTLPGAGLGPLAPTRKSVCSIAHRNHTYHEDLSIWMSPQMLLVSMRWPPMPSQVHWQEEQL